MTSGERTRGLRGGELTRQMNSTWCATFAGRGVSTCEKCAEDSVLWANASVCLTCREGTV